MFYITFLYLNDKVSLEILQIDWWFHSFFFFFFLFCQKILDIKDRNIFTQMN